MEDEKKIRLEALNKAGTAYMLKSQTSGVYSERCVYRIAKSFNFCASHIQLNLPAEHKCSRLHGHNYKLVVYLESESVDEQTGFVEDVAVLDGLKQYIDETIDHRHLNEIFDFAPSAENLAKHLFYIALQYCAKVCKVQLFETESIFAEYEVIRRRVDASR